jgi:hypothetical protein
VVLCDPQHKMGPAFGISGWLVDWHVFLGQGADLLEVWQQFPGPIIEKYASEL